MNQYSEHRDAVQYYALQSPENLLDVATMALLSIQQSWHKVGDMLADVREYGDKSKYLFGFKRTGYRYVVNNIDWLYAVTKQATSDYELLDAWSTVPGLGLVKAGFVVQLARGGAGCLDRHNIKEYGIPVGMLRFDKNLSIKARAVKLRWYLTTCEELGGADLLWEQWCVIVAGKQPQNFTSPQSVSRAHIEYLTGQTIIKGKLV